MIKPTREQTCEFGKRFAVVAVPAVAVYFASVQVGYLFGFIIGASVSPIATTVAPLVFGLLATAGAITGASQLKGAEFTLRGSVLAALTPLGVGLFCFYCERGIRNGIIARDGPYTAMEVVVPAVKNADSDVAAIAYRIRWAMKDRDFTPTDFWDYSHDVIEPVLSDKCSTADEKKAKLQAILDSLTEKPVPNK